MIDDPDLNVAMLQASGPLVGAAYAYGRPLPSVHSDEFLHGPLVVRQAVLVVCGISLVHRGDPVRAMQREASNDIHGGDTKFWRDMAAAHVPFDELQRRRGVTAA